MSIKLQNKNNHLIGVISDTHGSLQPSAIKLFANTDLIIHAGDIDKPEALFLNPGSATLPKLAYMNSAALLHIHKNS
ncbi:MAG: metallophosphoesterase family protein, partial [Thermodesulfobacteriota bacterium]|nr:metallophosphoesterase family protein [Thermodesulfobacteriota bacterium]